MGEGIVDLLKNTSGYEFLGEMKRQAQQPGLQLAKVTNITDPDKKNRVKCKVITTEDDEDVGESDWIPVMVPFGGPDYGQFFLPNNDDIVVLAYLSGDIHRPYVIGRVWTEVTTAPYTIDEGKNIVYSIKTPQKSELKFDDDAGKEKVSLNTPTLAGLFVDDENKLLKITDDTGENILKIDWNGGNIDVEAKTKITLKTGSATIEMGQDGAISIKGNEVSVEGTNVSIKASAQLSEEGATGELKASGNLTIKGAMVNIN